MTLTFPTFSAGLVLSLSLIMAIGPQNAHVLRMGLQRQHLWLTVATCALADIVLISLGVLGLAQLGGLSDKLHGALVGAGVLFLSVYGWQAFRRFLNPTTPVVPSREAGAAPMSRRQACGFSHEKARADSTAWRRDMGAAPASRLGTTGVVGFRKRRNACQPSVSYTHLRAHET